MKGTEEKILLAATRVFAQKGVSGATTREIAQRARVNEVTLFRHFKNKNELLRQVIFQSSQRFDQVFLEAPLKNVTDVHRTIENYAAVYFNKLNDNEKFVRTFMGELDRHRKLCRSLFGQGGTPVRQRFIAYLRAAKRHGLIRSDIDPVTAADTLSGMLLGGVMRRPLTSPEYDTKSYVKTCVKIYLRGLQK